MQRRSGTKFEFFWLFCIDSFRGFQRLSDRLKEEFLTVIAEVVKLIVQFSECVRMRASHSGPYGSGEG